MRHAILCGLLIQALLLPIGFRSASAAERKPNFIVIFSDDHGWADLGAQGVHTDLRTPHLDALAASGIRATNGYVTAPQCVPSRAGLLTGRFQNRFAVESNGAALAGFHEQLTLAERLKQVGYATGMSGKWHLGPQNEITHHGFDDVYCNQGGGGRAWANFDLDGNTIPGSEIRSPVYHLDANSAAACAFIKRHANEPFFFYLAYRAPHTPLDAPPKYTSRFPGPMPERRRQALAMISAIDDGVGKIVSTLRERGLEESTLLFFIGDNGAPLKIQKVDSPLDGDAGGWDGSLNTPLNGEKGMLTEGGIRVPWLAAWKGRIPPSQAYDHPVISLDVAATALAAAGLPTDSTLDGVNLLPYFAGEDSSPPHRQLTWRWIAQSAIREGKWKLLVGGSRSYLFDLKADPEEKHDLQTQHPEVVARLRTQLDSWSAQLQPPGLATQPMSAVWESYYDYYLDGKPALADANPRSAGWIVRNAKFEVEEGALRIIPESAGERSPFVAFNGLQIPGPAVATTSVRSEQGGKLAISWRLEGQRDFPASQVAYQEIVASAEFQSVSVDVPAAGRIVHVRLLLPAGVCGVKQFELKSVQGSAKRQWRFQASR